jgi:hypothetical protein
MEKRPLAPGADRIGDLARELGFPVRMVLLAARHCCGAGRRSGRTVLDPPAAARVRECLAMRRMELDWLEGDASDQDRRKWLEALMHQGFGGLHDPLEDDPRWAAVVRAAEARAQALAQARGIDGMGACHFIWREQERILREEHGLAWWSPAHLNPTTMYD